MKSDVIVGVLIASLLFAVIIHVTNTIHHYEMHRIGYVKQNGLWVKRENYSERE